MSEKTGNKFKRAAKMPAPIDPETEEAIISKGDDPVPAKAAAAKPKKNTDDDKTKDFLVPLKGRDHARLKELADALTQESFGTVSRRQLAAKLIAEGLDRLEADRK